MTGPAARGGRTRSAPLESPFQRAVAAIAADLLTRTEGERLATTQQYQEKLGIGAGTVVKALSHLQDVGAVRARGRGHQGTVITHRDPCILWQLAGRGPLRVTMTPPGAPDQFGLTMALREQLFGAGVPVEVTFIRGAQRRLERLRTGEADLVALSHGALHSMPAPAREALTIIDAGPARYYSPELLVVVEGRPGTHSQPRRVGIDRDSFDHVALTEAEFPAGVDRFVTCRFHEIPAAILEGRIDVGVWHRQLTLISPELTGLLVRPMLVSITESLGADALDAALCAAGGDAAVASVVGRLDTSLIRARQDEIMSLEHDTDEFQSRLWTR